MVQIESGNPVFQVANPFQKIIVSTCRKRLLATTLILLAPSLLLPAWSSPEISGWKITYTAAFPRKCEVFIAPAALKAVNGSGEELIAKAPLWDAYVFNIHSKTMCFLPFAKWHKQPAFMHMNELEPISDKHLSDGQGVFLGMPVVQFTFKSRSTDALFWQDREKPTDCVVRYCGTTKIPMTSVQRELIAAWLGTPRTKELPLFWGRTFSDGSKHFTLRAMAVAKQQISEDIFVVPANYKKSPNVFDVFEHQNQDMLNSVADFAASPSSSKGNAHK